MHVHIIHVQIDIIYIHVHILNEKICSEAEMFTSSEMCIDGPFVSICGYI